MTMKTSVKVAYDVIKSKILSCEYLPGQLISEKEIVEELDISRTPVREAINILNGEGLLTAIPKKGMQIAPLSVKRIKEIYDVRMLLEPILVRQAMKCIKPEDIVNLTELQRKLDNCFNKKDAAELFKAGNDIHLYIARLSNNETVFSLIKQLRDDSYRGYVYYLQRNLDLNAGEYRGEMGENLIDCMLDMHQKFIKSLIDGDVETAIRYIVEDLDTSKKLFTEF